MQTLRIYASMNRHLVIVVLLAVLIGIAGAIYVHQTGARLASSGAAPNESAPADAAANRQLGAAEALTDSRRAVRSNPSPDAHNMNRVPVLNFAEAQTPPAGTALDVYDRLVPLAESGDAHAAFQLYLKALECQQAMTSDVTPSTPLVSNVSAEFAANVEKQRLLHIEALLDQCEGLPVSAYDRLGSWLVQAAEGGNVIAQLLYARESRLILGSRADMIANPDAVAEYKRKAVAFLHSAVATGTPAALQAMSTAYRAGVLLPRDPIMSYAYANAANRAASGDWALDAYSRDLTPDELAIAKKRADAIYRKCCLQVGH